MMRSGSVMIALHHWAPPVTVTAFGHPYVEQFPTTPNNAASTFDKALEAFYQTLTMPFINDTVHIYSCLYSLDIHTDGKFSLEILVCKGPLQPLPPCTFQVVHATGETANAFSANDSRFLQGRFSL